MTISRRWQKPVCTFQTRKSCLLKTKSMKVASQKLRHQALTLGVIDSAVVDTQAPAAVSRVTSKLPQFCKGSSPTLSRFSRHFLASLSLENSKSLTETSVSHASPCSTLSTGSCPGWTATQPSNDNRNVAPSASRCCATRILSLRLSLGLTLLLESMEDLLYATLKTGTQPIADRHRTPQTRASSPKRCATALAEV